MCGGIDAALAILRCYRMPCPSPLGWVEGMIGGKRLTPKELRYETVFHKHGVQSYQHSLHNGPRPRATIDAIIKDVQIANDLARREN